MRRIRSNPTHRVNLAGTLIVSLVLLVLGAANTFADTNSPSPGTLSIPAQKLIERLEKIAAQDAQKGLEPRTIESLALTFSEEAKTIAWSVEQLKVLYDKEYARNKQSKGFLDLVREMIPLSAYPPGLALLGIFLFVIAAAVRGIIGGQTNQWIKDLWNQSTKISRKHCIAYANTMIGEFAKKIDEIKTTLPSLSFNYIPVSVADENGTSHDDVTDFFGFAERLLILGRPGSGKTLFLWYIARRLCESLIKGPASGRIPVIINLATFETWMARSLQETIFEELRSGGLDLTDQAYELGLKSGRFLVLIDAIDEVPVPLRKQAALKIDLFQKKFEACGIMLACREQAFDSNFKMCVDKIVRLHGFDTDRIERFLSESRPELPAEDRQRFLAGLSSRPEIMHLCQNPMYLGLIVNWIARESSLSRIELPSQRAFYFDKVISLQHERELRLKRSEVEIADVRRGLANLALALLDRSGQTDGTIAVSEEQLILDVTQRLDPKADRVATRLFLQLIAESTGIVRVRQDPISCEFVHKSFQEFWAAKALADDPSAMKSKFREDSEKWSETLKFWCGTVNDCSNVLREVYNSDPVFALECLAEARQVNSEVFRTIVDGVVGGPLYSEEQRTRIVRALSLLMSVRGSVGDYILASLGTLLKSPQLGSLPLSHLSTALANSRTPKAAELLARVPDAIPYLHLMGDMALPHLKGLIPAGDSSPNKHVSTAIAEISRINTPMAARELTSLLWHDDILVNVHAAIGLARVFPDDGIVCSLRDYPLSEEQRQKSLEWVWKPFAEPEGSSVPFIAGRVLMTLESYLPMYPIEQPWEIDWRFLVPMLIRSMDLRLSRSGESDRLRFLSEVKQIWDSVVNKLLNQRSAGSVTLYDQVRMAFIQKIAGLPEVAESSIDDGIQGEALLQKVWLSKQTSLRFIDSVIQSMPLSVVLEIVRSISRGWVPKLEDWKSAGSPPNKPFEKTWQYIFGLSLSSAVAVYGISLIWSAILTADHLVSFHNLFLAAAAGSMIMLLLTSIWFEAPYRFNFWLSPLLSLNTAAQLVLRREPLPCQFGSWLAIILGILGPPTVIYSLVTTLQNHFGWAPTLIGLFFFGLGVVGIVGWTYKSSLARENPLRIILGIGTGRHPKVLQDSWLKWKSTLELGSLFQQDVDQLAFQDLAELAELASGEAVLTLYKTGSVREALVLVQLLWNEQEALRYRAAWALAALIIKQDVEDALRNCELPKFAKPEHHAWVWKPYEEPRRSKLPMIAGRVVSLLKVCPNEYIPAEQLAIDPRLSIPLLTLKPFAEFDWRTTAPFVYRELATLLTESRLEHLHQLNLGGGAPLLEIIRRVLGPDHGGQAPADFLQAKHRIIEHALTLLGAHPKCAYLFRALTPALRAEIVLRLHNCPAPDKVDWEMLSRRNHNRAPIYGCTLSFNILQTLVLGLCYAGVWLWWSTSTPKFDLVWIGPAIGAVFTAFAGLLMLVSSSELGPGLIQSFKSSDLRYSGLLAPFVQPAWFLHRHDSLDFSLNSLILVAAFGLVSLMPVYSFATFAMLGLFSLQQVTLIWFGIAVLAPVLWLFTGVRSKCSANPLLGIRLHFETGKLGPELKDSDQSIDSAGQSTASRREICAAETEPMDAPFSAEESNDETQECEKVAMLVQLLWHDNAIVSSTIAWYLGVLLKQPRIESRLRQFSLTPAQRKGPHNYMWVWAPFRDDQGSSLPCIAGRIAYLLANAPDAAIPKDQRSIDPRVIVPLYLIKSDTHDSCAIMGRRARELAKEVASSVPELEELTHVRNREEALKVFQRSPQHYEELKGQLIQVAVQSSKEPARWPYLFSSLSRRIQEDLILRIFRYPAFYIWYWVNAGKETLEKPLGTWARIMIMLMASAVNLAAISEIVRDFHGWNMISSYSSITILIAGLFWMAFLEYLVIKSPAFGNCGVLELAFSGFYIGKEELSDHPDRRDYFKRILEVLVQIPPIYFVTELLLRTLPWHRSLYIWLAFFTVGSALVWYRAIRLWRSVNPLQGIIELFTRTDQDVPGREVQLRQAVSSCEASVGRDHLDTATRMEALAHFLTAKGDFNEAEWLLNRALEVRRKILGEDDPAIANSLSNLASVQMEKKNSHEAEKLLRLALATMVRAVGDKHRDSVQIMAKLSEVLQENGDLAEAYRLIRRTIEFWKSMGNQNDPGMPKALNRLAGLLLECGDYEEAEDSSRRAIVACSSLVGPEHPQTLALIKDLQGILLNHQDCEKALHQYDQLLRIAAGVRSSGSAEAGVALQSLIAGLANKKAYKKAAGLHEKALGASETIFGSDHPKTARALMNKAATTLLLQQEFDWNSILQMHGRALEIYAKSDSQCPPESVEAGKFWAEIARSGGDFQTSAGLYRSILQISERRHGKTDSGVLEIRSRLGVILYEKGDYEAAEQVLSDCLEHMDQIVIPPSIEASDVLNYLGLVHSARGDFSTAEQYFRRALEECEVVEKGRDKDIAQLMTNLADSLADKGEISEAEQMHRIALEIRSLNLGENDSDTAESVFKLADLASKKKDYTEAEALWRRYIKIREDLGDPEDSSMAQGLIHLGSRFTQKRNHKQAAPIFLRALALFERCLGNMDLWTGVACHKLALSQYNLDDREGAEQHLKRAVEIFEKSGGLDAGLLDPACFDLGSLLHRKGQFDEAAHFYRRTLEIREERLGPHHSLTISVLTNLAWALWRKGDKQEAESLCRRVLAVTEGSMGSEHSDTAKALSNLASLLWEKGDLNEAETLGRKALRIQELASDSDSLTVAGTLNLLGLVLRDKKHYAEAEKALARSLDIYREKADRLNVANTELNLQTVFHRSEKTVDLGSVERATQMLQDAGDSRAEKGHRLLADLKRG